MADPEQTRRLTAKERVLAYLQVHGRASNVTLNDICFRYGARIMELRVDHQIDRIGGSKKGEFIYVYKGRRDNREPRLPF
tara:strand:+ start:143 stop:382 length:240 start_codon:yes stop_codon:yes gene_type:complete